MIIYLIPPSRDARQTKIGGHDRRFSPSWCDDTRGSTDRRPSLCFVLHHMGFFVPRELLRER
jgi:hypothetical protein